MPSWMNTTDVRRIRLQLFAGMGFKLASESPVKFIVREYKYMYTAPGVLSGPVC